MRSILALTAAAAVLAPAVAHAQAQQGPGKGQTAPRAPQPALDSTPQVSTTAQGEWMPVPDIFPAGAQLMLLDGDMAKGASDLYLRFPSGYGVPMHFHTPNERLYVDQGTLEVRTIDGKTTTVSPGGFVMFPSRTPHQVTCTGEQECRFYLHSDGPFDIHRVDARGRVTASWSAAQAAKPGTRR